MDAGERFRKLALALPEAFESSHGSAADFRIHDRIFATLAYVARGLGTLKLTLPQQETFLADAPEYFEPAPGGWGRMGMTLVKLDAPQDVIAGALQTAYNNVIAKSKVRKRAATARVTKPRI